MTSYHSHLLYSLTPHLTLTTAFVWYLTAQAEPSDPPASSHRVHPDVWSRCVTGDDTASPPPTLPHTTLDPYHGSGVIIHGTRFSHFPTVFFPCFGNNKNEKTVAMEPIEDDDNKENVDQKPMPLSGYVPGTTALLEFEGTVRDRAIIDFQRQRHFRGIRRRITLCRIPII